MIQSPLAIVAVLLGSIGFSLLMVNSFPWAKRLSAIIWVIFTSALLSNVGLIPTDAPVYGMLIDFAVPFAVCIILFTVNLADVKSAGLPMLAAFALASLGTVLGVVTASLTLDPLLAGLIPEGAWKLAGPYTGTYIGGSLNFVGLWTGLGIDNPELLGAANAVDNITLFPLYAIWMVAPGLLASRWIVRKQWTAAGHDDDYVEETTSSFVVQDVAVLAFLAVGVIAVSPWLNETLIVPFLPGAPSILMVSALALILGQSPYVRKLKGAWEIGELAFLVFFAAIGALIDFYLAVVLSPSLFAYVLIIMAVHFIVLFGLGRVFRMDPRVLTMASVATKGGPALVPPVAEALGIRHLVLPGIIIGMLGYAVGNFVGYFVAETVRVLLG